MVTCGLCGLEYTPGGENCLTRGCPLAVGDCRLEHCPRCGYAVPGTNGGIAGWLRQRLGFSSPPVAPAGGRLTDLEKGSVVSVERVDGSAEVVDALTLLGVTPGSRLHLVQRFPSFVIEVEGTDLALERSIAETIRVRIGPTGA